MRNSFGHVVYAEYIVMNIRSTYCLVGLVRKTESQYFSLLILSFSHGEMSFKINILSSRYLRAYSNKWYLATLLLIEAGVI